jgi:His-Xaa-Ser system radical SAM maturase HxsC
MKKLFGIPQNVPSRIIGKITLKPRGLFQKKDYVLVADTESIKNGYTAIISSHKLKNKSTSMPFVYGVDDTNQLKDESIVSIDPDGTISVLNEKESTGNCLFITQQCNSSCIMCPQPPKPTDENRTPENLKIVSLLNDDGQSLALTGGEPTLIGEGLFEIIKYCKIRIPKTGLVLLTNGIRFSDFDFTRRLMSIDHPNLMIEVPLYFDSDTGHNDITGTKGFYRTMKGLYNLALFRARIGIRIVIIKQNYERLPQLADFIYRNIPFVYQIAFMQMEPIGNALSSFSDVWIDPIDYASYLERAVLSLNQKDMNVSIYNAQLCTLPKSIWKYAKKSISTWKNIYLNECEGCHFRAECGGTFSSSQEHHSRSIKAIKSLLKNPADRK